MEILVDERVELLGVLQTLGKFWDNIALKFCNGSLFQCKYKENIWDYFGKYINHETIKLINEFCNDNIHDISAPLQIVLCYSDPPKLDSIADFETNYKNILKSNIPLDIFINSLKQFYNDSNFKDFFIKNQREYAKLINSYEKKEEIEKYINISDNYYQIETKNYQIILSALPMGGFGIKTKTHENITLNYSVLCPYDYKNNEYKFGSKESILEILWHELGHLTINDLTRKYINQFNIENKKVPDFFLETAYRDIETIVNEYIIRATTIRLYEMQYNESNPELINCNIQNGFKEIESIKNYLSKNCEVNNVLSKDDKYKKLMDYVIKKILKYKVYGT